MDSSSEAGWQYIGEVIVRCLWVIVFVLADFNVWLVLFKAGGLL